VLIDPRLTDALETVTVAPDGRAAQVGDQKITAEDSRELRGSLALLLYRKLHSGAAPPPSDATMMPRKRHDGQFEDELHDAVPHRFTPSRGLLIDLDDTDMIVRLPEITARVPRERYAGAGEPTPGEIAEVLLDSRRPNVSPGFYYVMGSRRHSDPEAQVRRLFVHIEDSRYAPEIWHRALDHLERTEAGYHAKVLSDRSAYPRRDALVVYLTGAPAAAEQDLADALAGLPGIASDVSVYTERYRSGISGADDPVDERPGQSGLSFGQHRSTALATALIEHATTPGTASRDDVIARHFRAARIDPQRPARNLGAKDLTHV
jgi:hypothetical protein